MANAKDLFDQGKDVTELFNSGKVVEDSGSNLEDIVRGTTQGASFGFADELTGVLESALSDKTYEQARDESRAAYKASQERSPWLYGGAELAGGIASSVIPGVGGISKIPAIANLAKMGVLGKGAALATEGAALGGLYGAGASNAEEASGVAKDVLQGTATGAIAAPVVGGAINLAGKGLTAAGRGIEKTKDYLDKLPYVKTLKTSREIAKETGTIPLDLESRRNIKSIVKGDADYVANELIDISRDIDKAIGDNLEKAAKAGVKIEATPELLNSINDASKILPESTQQILSEIMTKDASNLGGLMGSPPQSRGINPSTLNQLRIDLRNRSYDFDPNGKIDKIKLKQIYDSLNNEADVVLGNMSDEYGKAYKGLNELSFSFKKNTSDILGNKPEEMSKELNKLFGKGVKGTEQGQEAYGKLANLKTYLDKTKALHAEDDVLERLNPEELNDVITKAANWGTTANKFTESVFGGDKSILANLVGGAGRIGEISAGVSGLAERKGGEIYQKTLGRLSRTTGPELEKFIGTLQTKFPKVADKYNVYIDRLTQAISNGDQAARNAVLFTLLQQSDIRDSISQSPELQE